MRATATSCTKSSTLAHVRTAPAAVVLAELSFGAGPAPISAASTAPGAPDTMHWAQGYSGCIGVWVTAVQPGSRPPPPALRRAGFRRHRLQADFAAHPAAN